MLRAESKKGLIRRPAIFLAICLLCVASAPAQFTPFEAAIADFDAVVAAGVAKDATGCVSVAVFMGNKVIWSKGYGWADIEKRVPADADTIGRIGSITKSFTAVVLMQLAERGILKIDDPVEKYFAEIKGLADSPENMRPITFRMLASHTAGLVREPQLEDAASGSIYFWQDKILQSIPKTRFQTAPLTEYSYSNIGFGILGLAISRATKVPYMELVNEQILKPLGMTSSTFILDRPDLWERMSVGYVKDQKTGKVSSEASTKEHFGRGYKVPNGGIYSTVGDLARFAAAMMGEHPVKMLSEDSRKEMLTAQAPAKTYGLGFTVQQGEGPRVVGHNGSVAGYNADLAFELDTKVGIAMLRTTSYNPPTGRLLQQLIAANKK
jgi:CubicO group peptidase (beta-lactamase class C family)